MEPVLVRSVDPKVGMVHRERHPIRHELVDLILLIPAASVRTSTVCSPELGPARSQLPGVSLIRIG